MPSTNDCTLFVFRKLDFFFAHAARNHLLTKGSNDELLFKTPDLYQRPVSQLYLKMRTDPTHKDRKLTESCILSGQYVPNEQLWFEKRG